MIPKRTQKATGKFGVEKVQFGTHKVEKEGEIMAIAKPTITKQSTSTIIEVANAMKKNDCRRILIVDPGTGKIKGIVKAMDIIDFLGGGSKYNIVLDNYKGNFLSAINCPVSKIMGENFSSLKKSASIEDALKILIEKHTSLIPILDVDQTILGVVSETDLLPSPKFIGVDVEEVMQKDVVTATPNTEIADLCKIMVRNGYRRVPVVYEGKLVGVVTVFDVLGFLTKGDFKSFKAEEVLSEKVDAIMEKEVMTVQKDKDIGEVSKLVRETGKGGFPVVHKHELIGIITTSDIIRGAYNLNSMMKKQKEED